MDSAAEEDRLAAASPPCPARLTLAQALESFPTDILWRILVSALRTIALRNTCKTVKRAFETLQPPVRVRFRSRRPNYNERRDLLRQKLMAMLPWCRITSLEAREWRFQLDGRKENIRWTCASTRPVHIDRASDDLQGHSWNRSSRQAGSLVGRSSRTRALESRET